MANLESVTVPQLLVLFLLAAGAIGLLGSHLARVADRLADETGWGEALMGGVFLGGITSLSGILTSVTAAAKGHPELAISNALGGIAAQTVFLAVADMTHRKANLEHAASSLPNMIQGALLIVLLAIPILAITGRDLTVGGTHPASVILILAYLGGLRVVAHSQKSPMWRPRQTPETRPDIPSVTKTSAGFNHALLWLRLGGCGIVVAAAGYVVAVTGIALSTRTGISEALVGGLLTAICTSLPELVTSLAAVRQGALTLAVGGIIGGNCFDVLFLAFSDFAYRDGSIYHAISGEQVYMLALTILLSAILLMGLLRREKHGIANIGFESFLILATYLLTFVLLAVPH
jgi:cation:H+ antiporter